MAKNSSRKFVDKKGKRDEKYPPKYKTIEETYGKNRISDEIKISKSIIIENDQIKITTDDCSIVTEYIMDKDIKRTTMSPGNILFSAFAL